MHRGSIVLGLLVSLAACGGRLAPIADAGTDGTSGVDASVDGDVSDGGASDDRGPGPIPVCTGGLSMCLPPDSGLTWTGSSVITCQPEEYPGPWTLLLERKINGNFTPVQVKVVQEPGFGVTLYDPTGQPALQTYRVCVDDDWGVRCGNAFTTQGPPNCLCNAFDCNALQACNSTVDNGCGGTITCGACAGGTPCLPPYNSCCPPNFMPDGTGGCVCAPPAICHGYWDPSTCDCARNGAPVITAPPPH